MALKKVEKGPAEDKYWKPTGIGDFVEGHFYKFENGDYGKQMVLYKGYDEEAGEYITQTLPAHADLKRSYVNLIPGAFTKVECVDVEQAKSKTGNDKFIYDIFQDDENIMQFEDSNDEYYADE